MRRLLLPLVCVFVSVVVVCLLSGCGGGGADATAGTGSLRVKVNWSAAHAGDNKLIPASTRCLKLEIYAYVPPIGSPGKNGETPVDTVLVPRQAGDTTTTTLTVPVGDYYIVASAHAEDDASDFPQAIGTTKPLTVDLNATTTSSLTLTGAVSSITLSPSLVMIYGGLGGTGKITVTAKDSANNVIILSPGAGSWTITPPGTLTIDASGNVSSLVANGSIYVRYTDSEHGITSNQITVAVPVY